MSTQVSTDELDLTQEEPPTLGRGVPIAEGREQHFDPDKEREETRGDLARGLLWLLTFAIGGVLAFIGLGRLDGTVLTQSIFPSLVALAGTALGFYFGSHNPVVPAAPGGGGGATHTTTTQPNNTATGTGAVTGAPGTTTTTQPNNTATGTTGAATGATGTPNVELKPEDMPTPGGTAEGTSTEGAGGVGTGAAGAGVTKEEEPG